VKRRMISYYERFLLRDEQIVEKYESRIIVDEEYDGLLTTERLLLIKEDKLQESSFKILRGPIELAKEEDAFNSESTLSKRTSRLVGLKRSSIFPRIWKDNSKMQADKNRGNFLYFI